MIQKYEIRTISYLHPHQFYTLHQSKVRESTRFVPERGGKSVQKLGHLKNILQPTPYNKFSKKILEKYFRKQQKILSIWFFIICFIYHFSPPLSGTSFVLSRTFDWSNVENFSSLEYEQVRFSYLTLPHFSGYFLKLHY